MELVGADGCDIMELACRADVLAMVAAERGRSVPAPPEYVFSPFDAVDDEDKDDVIVVSSDPVHEKAKVQWDAAYSALELLPPVRSSSYAAAHQRDDQLRMAYYWPNTKSVYLTSGSGVLPRDRRSEVSALAHELTHYMQDLELGFDHLDEIRPANTDARSALRAYIEGEASYVGWSLESRLHGVTSDAAGWTAYFDRLDGSYLARVQSSRSPLATALDVMPYSIGARRVAELWLDSGREAVDALSANIPLSFAAWMRRDAPSTQASEVGCGVPAAPNGYALIDQTRLGALGALAFLSAGYADDLDAVAPLRADTVFLYAPLASDSSANGVGQVYTNRQANVVAVWLLRFDSEADARTFELAIPVPSSGDRTFTRKGAVVALAVSTDPTQHAASPIEALACPTT